MSNWVNAKIIKIKKWTPNLFTLILNAPIKNFIAGQFAKISIQLQNNNYIRRVYSYVNAPNNKNLEFYITLVKNGIMSNQLYNLKKGNKILISKYASGFFTIQEIPKKKYLWMFSTGTAIGPYCSILQNGKGLQKFHKIILIHAVKYYKELIYLNKLKKIQKKNINQIIIQIIISQEIHTQYLFGRIPFLLKKNILEKKIGYTIKPNNSHIMLCGNPNMVKDTQHFLIKNRMLKKHLRSIPGNISSENYW